MRRIPILDVPRIIRHFGGDQEVVRALGAVGVRMSVAGVQKWRERGRIPGNRLVELVGAAKERGLSFDLTRFLVWTDGNGEPRS